MSNSIPASPKSMIAVLQTRLREDDCRPAMLIRNSSFRPHPRIATGTDVPDPADEVPPLEYFPVTWSELREDVLRLASVLDEDGVEPGAAVVQVSENSYEWVVLDLALHALGAVHVPIHASLTGAQIAYQINHSDARHVVVSGPLQADKLKTYWERPDAIRNEQTWPHTRWYSYRSWHASAVGQNGENGEIPPLAARIGRTSPESGRRRLEASAQAADGDDVATILYTSGTTGEPKGVMLTQANLLTNSLAALKALPPHDDDVRLCFLPMSHIFARTCDVYTWLALEASHLAHSPTEEAPNLVLALAESRESVMRDLATVRPTTISGVPYFFGKLAKALCDTKQHDVPGVLQHLLGGRIRLCASGGAALPRNIYEIFCRQDVPLLQGYGLTETSPVISISTLQDVKPDASGKPIQGIDVRCADDGEILTRGPHVMKGYYKDPAATAEVIRDGWFYTGDLGYLDEDGFLFITGRKKEIIVTAGGKNVAPVYLESLLTQDPLIQQALVVGDDRKYLTALLVPDPDQLPAAIAEHNIAESASGSLEDVLANDKVKALVESRIRKALENVSHYEQIQKFQLLSRGFTIESGELTAKLTLRREVILKNFSTEIEQMYDDPCEDVS